MCLSRRMSIARGSLSATMVLAIDWGGVYGAAREGAARRWLYLCRVRAEVR